MSRLGRKLGAFFRTLVSTAQPMDRTTKYPPRVSLYALVSAGIVLLELIYFYEVPYDQMSDKAVFFLSLIGWAFPPILVEWAYVNSPTRRGLNAYLNMMIGIGILGIVVATIARSIETLVPVALALMPGAMAGGLTGSDSTLLWRLYVRRRSRKSGAKLAEQIQPNSLPDNKRLYDDLSRSRRSRTVEMKSSIP